MEYTNQKEIDALNEKLKKIDENLKLGRFGVNESNKAMEMCREKYQGFFTKGNCMLDHPKVFRFPEDDEI